jgi:xanthosine utilization system XapX-like protein
MTDIVFAFVAGFSVGVVWMLFLAAVMAGRETGG